MRGELLVSFFDVRDIRYLSILPLPLRLTAIVDCFLLLGTQIVVDFFCDPKLEVDGDVRVRPRRLDRTGGRVVLVSGHVRLLLLLPAGDDNLLETGFPGVGTVSLSRGELPFFILAQSQIRF